MDSNLLLYAALGSVAVASSMLTYLVMVASAREQVLGAETEERERRMEMPVMRLILAFARALAPLHKGALESRAGQQLERKLKRAGRPFGVSVPEFLCFRYVGLLAGALLGYALGVAAYDQPSPGILLAVAGFGFLYPQLRLNAVMEKRMRRIFRDLPYAIDLLTLSTEAGQDFSSAMASVVEKGSPGPLRDELRIVTQEVTLGKTRADALRSMAERVDLPEVTSFVLALGQAEQLGTGVANVLRVMAEQTRVKRWQLAEEMAGKVPVKLMAPLIACIFPASFIVLFVPLALESKISGGF